MKKEFPFAKFFLSFILTITPTIGLFINCFSIGGGDYVSVPNGLIYLFKSVKFLDEGKGYAVLLIIVLLIVALLMAVALYDGIRAFLYCVSGNRIYLAGSFAKTSFSCDVVAASVAISLIWIFDLLIKKGIGFSILSPSHGLLIYLLWTIMALLLYAPMLKTMWEKEGGVHHNFTSNAWAVLIIGSIASFFIETDWVSIDLGGFSLVSGDIFSVFSVMSFITDFVSIGDGAIVYVIKGLVIVIIVMLFAAILALSRFFVTVCIDREGAGEMRKQAGRFFGFNLAASLIFMALVFFVNHGSKDAFDTKLFAFTWKFWVFFALNFVVKIVSSGIVNRYFPENKEDVAEAPLEISEENRPFSEKSITFIDTLITVFILLVAFSYVFLIPNLGLYDEDDDEQYEYFGGYTTYYGHSDHDDDDHDRDRNSFAYNGRRYARNYVLGSDSYYDDNSDYDYYSDHDFSYYDDYDFSYYGDYDDYSDYDDYEYDYYDDKAAFYEEFDNDYYSAQESSSYSEDAIEIFDANHETYEITPSYLSASSTLPADNLKSYEVEHILDGKFDSVWSEGVSGLGEGEYIYFEFDAPVYITKMELWIGHHGSQELFEKNAVPTEYVLEYDYGNDKVSYETETVYPSACGESVTITRPDAYSNLEEFYPTDRLVFTISAARTGTKWEDTCVTDVKFYGYYVE